MEKKDIFKIISLLLLADAASNQDQLIKQAQAEGFQQSANSACACSDGGNPMCSRLASSYSHTFQTNYTYKVWRGGNPANAEAVTPSTKLYRGDKLVIDHNTSLPAWTARITAYDAQYGDCSTTDTTDSDTTDTTDSDTTDSDSTTGSGVDTTDTTSTTGSDTTDTTNTTGADTTDTDTGDSGTTGDC